MQTKHIIFGAATVAFAGLVAHSLLTDNGQEIPDNLTGSATLACNGTISPVKMTPEGPLVIKEDTLEANEVNIALHFNSGKVVGWNYIPSQNPTNPMSNLEISAKSVCPYTTNDCMPKLKPDKTIQLFEYAYIIEGQDESDDSSEPQQVEIKGYGMLSSDFHYYAGLQEKDGKMTASALSCKITELNDSYAMK